MPNRIETVTSLSQRLDAHLIKCEASNDRVEVKLEKLTDKLEAIEKLPGQVFRWLGLTIAGAAVSILAQNFLFHGESVQVARQAAANAQQAAAVGNQVKVTLDKAVGGTQ